MSDSRKGILVWITGLAGSGKTMLAEKVFRNVKNEFPQTIHLDGDTVRNILGDVYGHTVEDRIATARIYSRICKELVSQGMIVVFSTISLFREIHEWNREHNEKYVEILLMTDRDVLLKRNKKGLYDANNKNVMGIHQEPEFPEDPSLTLESNFRDDIDRNEIIIVNHIKDIMQ